MEYRQHHPHQQRCLLGRFAGPGITNIGIRMTTPVVRSILISGCSSGIGLACAEGLQQRGYRVFASARKAADVEQLRAKGLDALRLDLDDSSSITDAVQYVLSRTGGTLDALFNNGGYGQPGAVEDVPSEALRANFQTNLFGPHELTRQIIPVMRKQGYGRIVQNSSVLGLVAMPYRGAYTATKFAIEGLSDTLRLELNGTGIHVCLIEPGPIRSHFRANSFAKYQQYIDKENSPHRQIYEGMERRLTKVGPAQPYTLGPEAVLEKLIHALESPRPRQRYPVTVPTQFLGTLKRWVSGNTLDQILLYFSRRENR